MSSTRLSPVMFVLVSAAFLLYAQQQPAATVSNTYTLGPNDQVTVDVVELPEFHARTYRVDSDGTVDLPLIGNVQATGLTLSQFKAEVTARLHSQVLNPHVSASLSETKSQPVSVMGEVNAPGMQQMDGQKRLFDVLAGAGGLKADAGDDITVTRERGQSSAGLPNSTIDPVSGSTVAHVNSHDLMDLKDPSANIIMRPHDEVSVGKAKLVYVIGDVKKAGGFTLSEKRSVSALEALSLAEGLESNAAPQSARVLRRVPNNDIARQQIPINLKKILSGKAEDIRLQPDDILFVPDNRSRRIAARVAETALATISGIVIWRGI